MKIECLTQKDTEEIKALVASYKFNEYRNYRIIKKNKKEEYLFSQVSGLAANNKEACVVVAKDGAKIVGLASLIKLPWDSRHFGFNMAKIGHLMVSGDYNKAFSVKKALVSFILQICRKEDIRHVSCRIDTSDFTSLHVLEADDFRIMDTMVTYIFNRFKHRLPCLKKLYDVRLFRQEDLSSLLEIAYNRLLYGRFYNDVHLPRQKTEKMYMEWIKNYCSDLEQNRVFVIEKKNRVSGFLLYKKNMELERSCGIKIIGSGLSVVSPDAKGGYPALVMATAEDVISLSYDISEYDTQLNNYESIKVMQGFGLDYVKSRYTLHKWLPKSNE